MNDLAHLDATAQAELVRRGEIKPIELVEATIDRIERLNPILNAVITPMYEQARQAAAAGRPAGPFNGVPFLLKDLIAEYGGVPLHEGTSFLQAYVAPVDSELVRRLRAAGLIVVGKTNCGELGMMPTTEPRLFGPTKNPWNLDCTPGGSSGGSAAAVAAGIVPMAHANDAGGSIRNPASSCGLFGLKPTRARNPLGPHYGDMYAGLIVEHAVTRSVRDSAALLDASAGPDAGDPYVLSPPERPFIAEVGADPGRLRVGFSVEAPSGLPVHPDCVAAVRDAAALCEALGHELREAAPHFDAELLHESFTAIICAGTAWAIDDWARRTQQDKDRSRFEPVTWAMAERGWRMTAADHLLAVQDMQQVSRDVAHFFNAVDVWLTPTLGTPPPPFQSFERSHDNRRELAESTLRSIEFTRIANVTGQPAMSVPLYWNVQGLPIGVHFSARFGDEATLFRLAAQLEEARPWVNKRPPIYA